MQKKVDTSHAGPVLIGVVLQSAIVLAQFSQWVARLDTIAVPTDCC